MKNIVKSDVASPRHEPRPDLEIAPDTGIGVIAINEEEINCSAAEHVSDVIASLERMTILSQQDHLYARPIDHKLSEQLLLCFRITAAACPSEHIDRNNQLGSNATPS